MVHNRLVVLFRVLLEKMLAEIRVPGAFSIEIIGYIPGDVGLIGAITFAACVLEDGIAIRRAIGSHAQVADFLHLFDDVSGGWKFDFCEKV